MTATSTLPRWRAFPPLALGTLMATVDISAVNIALPTLSRTFRQPITTVEWVVLAYALTITGLLLAFGRSPTGLAAAAHMDSAWRSSRSPRRCARRRRGWGS